VKGLWIALTVVLIFGFVVLGCVGNRIYQDMPPIPERIVASDGRVVAREGDSGSRRRSCGPVRSRSKTM
jgi:nitric oxide reductase subunit B